jgi:hypothetical protein
MGTQEPLVTYEFLGVLALLCWVDLNTESQFCDQVPSHLQLAP